MEMHSINGVYLEINGNIFETKMRSFDDFEQGEIFEEIFLEPVKKKYRDLKPSKNDKKADKKKGKKEDIDPRMD